MKNALIFLGPPGCGKGTQIRELQKKNPGLYKKVSTGDLLRKEIASESDIGKQIKSIVDSGLLTVSDDILYGLLEDIVHNSSDNIILDGFPRSLDQALFLDKLLQKENFNISLVLSFELDHNIIVHRLSGRLQCKNCDTPYHEVDAPPPAGVCSVCRGTDFYKRPDDDKNVVLTRLDSYDRFTLQLNSFYAKRNILVKVDASLTVEALKSCIDDILKEHRLVA